MYFTNSRSQVPATDNNNYNNVGENSYNRTPGRNPQCTPNPNYTPCQFWQALANQPAHYSLSYMATSSGLLYQELSIMKQVG